MAHSRSVGLRAPSQRTTRPYASPGGTPNAVNGLVVGTGGLAIGNGIDLTPATSSGAPPAAAAPPAAKKKCKKAKKKKSASSAKKKGCKKKKK